MNCAKARACHDQGFKFALLLMDSAGNCTRLPKGWAYMSVTEVMEILKESKQK